MYNSWCNSGFSLLEAYPLVSQQNGLASQPRHHVAGYLLSYYDHDDWQAQRTSPEPTHKLCILKNNRDRVEWRPVNRAKKKPWFWTKQKNNSSFGTYERTLGVQMLEMQERLQLCLGSTLPPLHEQLHHQQQLSSTILDCVECLPDDSWVLTTTHHADALQQTSSGTCVWMCIERRSFLEEYDVSQRSSGEHRDAIWEHSGSGKKGDSESTHTSDFLSLGGHTNPWVPYSPL